MKKTLFFLLAAAILFWGYRIFVSQPQVKKKSIPYETIICFGDSLTFGTGAVPGMDYPSQLSKLISKPLMNAGVPGDTTASALMVLITLGGNDLKNGVAKEVAFKNLKRIVTSIQGQGARVVIGGLKFPFRDRGFARGYKDLADQTGAVLIPDIFKDIIGNRSLMSDPIHPNGNGYKIMAQRFLEAMPPR